jgi:hypothetical protein
VSYDQSQQIDHAERAYFTPCPDCGGPQYDDVHADDCPRLAAAEDVDRDGRVITADPCADGCDPLGIVAIDAFDDTCTRCHRVGPNLHP